ncbi:MAG: hypothetical protein ACMXYC_04725 [Candidatus Woesearchaeota archaeon]
MNEWGYNINQIAKLNNISVGSVFKVVKELEKHGIVFKNQISNASYYQLNVDNCETIALCEFLLLRQKKDIKGYVKVYADEIMAFKQAEIIILFGSILKRKDYNDVDVLFVTNHVKKVHDFCLHISQIRTKPVVPFILKKEDIIEHIQQKHEVVLNIIKQGVLLKGQRTFLEVVQRVRA